MENTKEKRKGKEEIRTGSRNWRYNPLKENNLTLVRSHLTRVRELQYRQNPRVQTRRHVAPHAGA
jgi:hypothetical protein